MHSMPFVSTTEASVEAGAAQFTFWATFLLRQRKRWYDIYDITASIFVKKKCDDLWTGSRDFSFLHFKKVSNLYKLKRFPLSFQVIFALKYNYCNWISFKLNSSFTKPRRTKLDYTFYVMLHVECDLFVTILSFWVWCLRGVCLFSPCLHWVSPPSSNNPKICMLD